MTGQGAAESEFPGGVHQRREGTKRGGLTAEDAAAQRADLEPGGQGRLDLARLQPALGAGHEGGGPEGRGLDGGAEGAGVLVLIEQHREVRGGGALEGRGVGGEHQDVRDAAPAALPGGGGGDLLPALQLFLEGPGVGPGDAAGRGEGDDLRRAQLRGLLDDVLQLVRLREAQVDAARDGRLRLPIFLLCLISF